MIENRTRTFITITSLTKWRTHELKSRYYMKSPKQWQHRFSFTGLITPNSVTAKWNGWVRVRVRVRIRVRVRFSWYLLDAWWSMYFSWSWRGFLFFQFLWTNWSKTIRERLWMRLLIIKCSTQLIISEVSCVPFIVHFGRLLSWENPATLQSWQCSDQPSCVPPSCLFQSIFSKQC